MNYLAWMLCLLTYDSGQTNITVDRVDVIELNHYDGLDQIIFYDRSSDYGYRVRAWRRYRTVAQVPIKLKDGTYRATWYDTFDYKMRTVYAKSFVETWTDYDPEMIDGNRFERSLRKELK